MISEMGFWWHCQIHRVLDDCDTLSISYCESLGDTGMIPVLKTCTNLRSLEMDNTRISDLVLTEAAAMVRQRAPRTLIRDKGAFTPATGLRLVAYDCQNVTWTGVREVLSRNAEVFVSTHATELPPLEKPKLALSATSSSEDLSTRSSTPRICITRTTSYPSRSDPAEVLLHIPAHGLKNTPNAFCAVTSRQRGVWSGSGPSS